MWEDFYNEGPSDFDIAIEEFKEGLRKTVKEEILNEMTRLKKENEKLQEAKEIIRLLLHALKNEGSDYTFALENTHPVLAEAEKFLKN